MLLYSANLILAAQWQCWEQDVTSLFALSKILGKGQFGTTRVAEEKSTGHIYACKSIAKRKLQYVALSLPTAALANTRFAACAPGSACKPTSPLCYSPCNLSAIASCTLHVPCCKLHLCSVTYQVGYRPRNGRCPFGNRRSAES